MQQNRMDVSEFFSLSSILFLVCRFTLRTHSEGSSPSLGTKSQTTRPKGCNVCSYNGSVGALVQSHAPSRGATNHFSCRILRKLVSIHAPSRGATGPPTDRINHTVGFNPRTLTGCDDGIIFFRGKVDSFQSTHPHGVRPVSTSDVLMPWKFQSTHPHGVRRNFDIFFARK